jgi:hypothetical protein
VWNWSLVTDLFHAVLRVILNILKNKRETFWRTFNTLCKEVKAGDPTSFGNFFRLTDVTLNEVLLKMEHKIQEYLEI